MHVALRKWNLDPRFAQLFFNREIEIALEPAGTMAHFGAPDDELEVDRAFAESSQENARRWVLQNMRVTSAGSDQRLAHFLHVAAISHADRHTEPHPRIEVGPVRHRRIDEFRIRHDHGDVVVRHDHRAPGANLLHLPDDAGYFHTIADRDRALGQDHQAADEIAGNILQTETDTDADGAGENSKRTEMNPRAFEHDENANDTDEVADNLRDRVLKRTVETAVNQEAVEEKTLRARGKPEDRDEKRDEQEELNQTQRDARDGRGPEQRDTGGVDRVNGKKNQSRDAQDRGDDRDEIRVELEAGEKTPDDFALEARRNEQPEREQRGESDQPKERNVVSANVKQRPLEEGEVHRFSLGGSVTRATAKRGCARKLQIPSTKLQRNPKSQAPKRIMRDAGFGIWCLELFWSLVLGIWSFPAPCRLSEKQKARLFAVPSQSVSRRAYCFDCFSSMYLMTSPTVCNFSASSSGTSTENSSSKAITSSTISSESAPRSSMNDAVGVTCSGFTPSCSTMISFTFSSIDLSAINFSPLTLFEGTAF